MKDARREMADLLSAFLAETGISQGQLSAELAAVGYSVAQPNICRWLQGNETVTPKTYSYMAHNLGKVRNSLAARWDAYHRATYPATQLRAAVALLPNGDTWFAKYQAGGKRSRVMLRRTLHEGFPELAGVTEDAILAAMPSEGEPTA